MRSKKVFTPDHEVEEMFTQELWDQRMRLLQVYEIKEMFAPDYEITEMFTPDLKNSRIG